MSVKKNIVLISIFCLLFSACSKKGMEDEQLRPVKYIEISQDLLSSGDKIFSGVVQSDISTNLSFRVDGYIESLNVNEGEFLKKGQIIATLDPTSYYVKDDELDAEVEQSYSKYSNNAKYYVRLAKLYKEGAISDRQLDDAKANAESSANELKSAMKRSEYQSLLTGSTILRAPIDGYVSEIKAEINENVTTGEPIITLISTGEIKIKTNIPEDYINFIKKGAPVSVNIEALGLDEIPGYISNVGVDALSNFTTFPVIIKLFKPNPNIKSGMSADVRINVEEDLEKLLIIPLNAVMDDGKSKYVYTLKQVAPNKATAVKTIVEIGEIYAEGIKIKKGLKYKDKLVVAGVSKISNGMLVRLDGPAK